MTAARHRHRRHGERSRPGLDARQNASWALFMILQQGPGAECGVIDTECACEEIGVDAKLKWHDGAIMPSMLHFRIAVSCFCAHFQAYRFEG